MVAQPVRALRPESIRRECEASLKRLGIERIDLYQFHWPDSIGTPLEDSWNAMLRLIDDLGRTLPGFAHDRVGLVASVRQRLTRGVIQWRR